MEFAAAVHVSTAALGIGVAVVAATAAISSAVSSRRSALIAQAQLRGSLRPILVVATGIEPFYDEWDEANSRYSGNVLQVENVGVGPALNVHATAVLTYYGYLSSSGESRPQNIAADGRDELRIVQDQPYGPSQATTWNVRVTYEDASGFGHWIAVDYTYRSHTTTERGKGRLPHRLRLMEGPAWDGGPPTIAYSFVERVRLRVRRAFGEISDWRRLHEVESPKPGAWPRARAALPTLRRIITFRPEERENDRPVERGIAARLKKLRRPK